MNRLSTPVALLLLAACATIEPVRELQRLPTSDEVVAYISDHWDEEHGQRFSLFADRRLEKPALLSVNNVSCGYYIATPECSFDVAARFPDGTIHQLSMDDQFGWDDDGHLETVIVMYHYRKR